MLLLFNCILLILPRSRFSPYFSQLQHIVNILDDAKKNRKKVSGSHNYSLCFFFFFFCFIKQGFFTQQITIHFLFIHGHLLPKVKKILSEFHPHHLLLVIILEQLTLRNHTLLYKTQKKHLKNTPWRGITRTNPRFMGLLLPLHHIIPPCSLKPIHVPHPPPSPIP